MISFFNRLALIVGGLNINLSIVVLIFPSVYHILFFVAANVERVLICEKDCTLILFRPTKMAVKLSYSVLSMVVS